MRRLCLLVLILGGCSKASDATNGKQLPRLPPPPHVELPAGTRIAVEVGEKEAPPVDNARLQSLKPDFEDAEHRAWRLSALLGEHGRYAVTGDNDVTVEFKPDAELQPSLMLTRRGELVALLLDPANPFPPFHGQGRRLGRPGDPLPRISGVRKIRASDAPDPRGAGAASVKGR